MALALLAGVLLTAGCATPPTGDEAAMAAYEKANDPLEPTNRALFGVNLTLDKTLVKPVAAVYRDVVPEPGRNALANFLSNLRGPVIFANDVAQGNAERAVVTLFRFLINSSFGFFGVADPARDMGFQPHDEDFGQTLAVWGVGEGPYLMLPVFGPSNPRDGVGLLVDLVIDPFRILVQARDADVVLYGRSYANAVEARAEHYDEINDLERTSLDFYAAVRSLYRQRRADEIRNGVPTGTPVPRVLATPAPALPPVSNESQATTPR